MSQYARPSCLELDGNAYCVADRDVATLVRGAALGQSEHLVVVAQVDAQGHRRAARQALHQKQSSG